MSKRAIILTLVDHVGNRFVELGHWTFATADDLDAHWRAVPDGPEWNVIADRHDAEALAENEGRMAEHAAMAVTCEQFGIEEDEGYDLLLALSQEPSP